MNGEKGKTGPKLTRALWPAVFFAFTVGIAIPTEIYFGNEKEFLVGYGEVLPLTLIAAAALFLAAFGAVFLLRKKKKPLLFWLDLLFGGTLAVYLQQNLLNGELQQLNGTETVRNGTSFLALAGLAVWAACLVVPHVVRKIRPRAQALVRRYGSILLTVTQAGALAIMILNSTGPAASRFTLTKKDEFTVSPEGNIIVFVVDTLDAQWAEDYVPAGGEYGEALQDFTYFNNVVAGGAPTILGMPTLFTGEIYDPGTTIEKYMEAAYRKSTLFTDLRDNGYRIRLYTSGQYLTGTDGNSIENSEISRGYRIRFRKKFFKDLYLMTAYKGLPYQLKEPFKVYSGELTGNYYNGETQADGYELDDAEFYREFKARGLTLSGGGKVFVVYHFFGAHGPFSMNENGEKVSRKETSREQQVRGVFRIIADYMEALKAQGVYDSSMIVITADHGGVSLYQNPAVFVKPADAHRSEMAVNDAPLTFRNLRAAFMEEATGLRNEAYGDGMFTEPPRGVPRTHTFDAVLYKNVYGETSEKEYGKARYLTFEFGDPARDDGQIVKPQQDRTE